MWTTLAAVAVSVSLSSAGVQPAEPAAPGPEDAAADAEETAPEAVVPEPEQAVENPEPDPEDPKSPEDPKDPEEPEEASPPVDMGDALMNEAWERFVDGNTLFEERRYLAAAAAYERSYAAVPTGRALYNLGLAWEKGGNYVRALETDLRYIELPDCPQPQMLCADRRDEVKETVSKLRGKVGMLSIVIDDGVELRGIEIEDRILPPEDFPLTLTPGLYELRVRGVRRSEVRTREVEIEAGGITSLLITGFNVPEPTPRVEEPKGDGVANPRRFNEEERRRRLRLAFYGGVGFTAAAGIATGVVGGLAWQAHNEWDSRCKGVGNNCTGTTFPADARRRVETLRPVTNALVGTTAALGITTVVLGLFAFSGRKGPGTRASVTRVTPTPSGVRVRF